MQDAALLHVRVRSNLICTFDAIHNQADPVRVLENIARALRHDGMYVTQHIRGSAYLEKNLDHPLAPWLYTISTMHS